MHQRLSDRKLKSLRSVYPNGHARAGKALKAGERYDVMDTDVRGFGVRVTDKGQRTFILLARYPGSTNPTRRALGEYPTLNLADARKKAKTWRDWIAEGKDPKDEEEKKRREELRKRADTFDSVVDEYAGRVLDRQRRGADVARELRTFFGKPWRGRSITSIERPDVVDVINECLDRGAMYQAHNLLGHIRALFNWAIETEDYGLESSPCDRIRPKRFIGERKPRQRVLGDAELCAFWTATERLEYPYGPLCRLLLLTGCRTMEIGGARWREIDMDKALLTVPPERFKSDATHLVPLANDSMAILGTLPRFTKGDHLFSFSYGVNPVGSLSDAKARLDRLMAEELGAPPEPWQIRDLRRTVRTGLATCRVPDVTAELVIGHGKKGLQRVYDQHMYIEEMSEAAELWASRLRDIVRPPPENVVELERARG
jgi:integrase